MSRFFNVPILNINDFKSENWNSLSLRNKFNALQNLEDYMANKQGRDARQVVFTDLGEGNLGVYDPSDPESLYVNPYYFSDPYETMNTVIHEGRHAYQDDALLGRELKNADAIDDETKEMWAKCRYKGVYFDPDDGYYKYRFQANENDANTYAASEMANFSEALGDDPAYSEYMERLNEKTQTERETAECLLGPDYINDINAETNERFNQVVLGMGNSESNNQNITENSQDAAYGLANEDSGALSENGKSDVLNSDRADVNEPENTDTNNDYVSPLKSSSQDELYDYMARNRYKNTDRDTYSKDPEWQRLDNAFREDMGKEPIAYESEEDKYLNGMHDEFSRGMGIPEGPEMDAMMANEKNGYESIHGKDSENEYDAPKKSNENGNESINRNDERADPYGSLNGKENRASNDDISNEADKYASLYSDKDRSPNEDAIGKENTQNTGTDQNALPDKANIQANTNDNSI